MDEQLIEEEGHSLPPEVEERIRQDAREMGMDEEEALRAARRIVPSEEGEG